MSGPAVQRGAEPPGGVDGALAERLVTRLRGRFGGPPAVLLLDGRSGSGKTVLAGLVAEALRAQQLHLDDLYPGWDGLAAGSRVVSGVLRLGGYRRYDWHAGAPAEQVALDPRRPVVVEGCGAVTARNLSSARAFARSSGIASRRDPSVWSVWLECPAELRRERALARDGDTLAPHWDDWARQEEEQLAAEHPLSLAAEVLHVA